MRFLLLFPFFFLLFPAIGFANNCEKVALQSLIKEHVKPKTYDEYEMALHEMKKKSKGGPSYMAHLKGEYQYARFEKVPQVKVVSGLHTNEGLDFLKKMRPDVANEITVSVLPNGVQLADIPKAALSERRLGKAPLHKKVIDGREIIYIQHTLFPQAWSEQEIMQAVKSVRQNRASFVSVKSSGTFITGTYKGVKIRVIMRDGEIKTAFPMAPF